MITDALGTYCEKQEMVDGAVSESVIDHANDGFKVGGGAANKYLDIIVTTSYATATSEEFQLKVSDSEDMSSATIVFSTGAIPIASLTAGTHLRFPIPANAEGQYSRVDSVEVGTTGTAGSVSIYLTY